MNFPQAQKIVFWCIVVLVGLLIGSYEYSGFYQSTMSTSPKTNSFRYIYSNGPYGTYRLGTVNGESQQLPQVNGKEYNVVFFRGALINDIITSYYLVPETVLSALPNSPCYSASQRYNRPCSDLLSVPETQHIADRVNTKGIIFEALVMLVAPIVILWFVWRRYIHAHYRH